jgi:hypothetical protein
MGHTASTPVIIVVWDNYQLPGSNSADLTAIQSDVVDLNSYAGAHAYFSLANISGDPALCGQVQIQVSGDGTKWYDFKGPIEGGGGAYVDAEAAYLSGISIPMGIQYLRFTALSNSAFGMTLTLNAYVVANRGVT